MASHRRHATTPYAVARAKRYLRSHMLETGPRHHGGPVQSYEPGEAVAAMFAAFRHRLDEMVPVSSDPVVRAECTAEVCYHLTPADCPDCAHAHIEGERCDCGCTA